MITAIAADVPPPLCGESLWSHINGWEVVVVASLLVIGWAVVNVARMHFMVQISRKAGTALQDSEEGKL